MISVVYVMSCAFPRGSVVRRVMAEILNSSGKPKVILEKAAMRMRALRQRHIVLSRWYKMLCCI